MRSSVLVVAAVLLARTAAAGPNDARPEGWNGYATAEDCAPADTAPALYSVRASFYDWASKSEIDRLKAVDVSRTRVHPERATWVLMDVAVRELLPLALAGRGERRAAARLRGLPRIAGATTATAAARALEALAPDVATPDLLSLSYYVDGLADDPTPECAELGSQSSLLGDAAYYAVKAGVSRSRALAIAGRAVRRAARAAR